jgi:hypothetical protein
MTYSVQTYFLPAMPKTLRRGETFRLIACHTTEGGAGFAGAKATADWMAATAAQRNASYHEMWAWDPPTFTVLQLVPATHASHSVGPQVDVYTPDAWVVESLGAGWRDPNYWIYAVSIAGTVGLVNGWAQDPAFLAACNRRMAELKAALGVSRRAEHFRFNPRTRTDWGTVLTPLLGGLTIPDPIPEPEPVDVPLVLAPVQEDWTSVAGQPFYTEGPGMGEKFWADSATRFRTHFEEVIYGADGQPTTKPRGYRLASYQDHPGAPWEVLYVPRLSGTPIKGTRVPASGYGLPPDQPAPQPVDCTEQVNAAKTATASKANAQMDAWMATRPPIVP